MPFATPNTLNPVALPNGDPHLGTVFLSAAIDHPRLQAGDYSYASAFDPPQDWAARLAPYLFDFSPERLVIGKFCQIADKVTFITSSANHRYDGISTYPFAIFDGGAMDGRASMPDAGSDTFVGHDVWIGQGATILPGAQLGHGVIVGAGAVVGGKIPDYSIVAGNPARVVRMRFNTEEVSALLRAAWWNWDIQTILDHEAEISGANITALSRISSKV